MPHDHVLKKLNFDLLNPFPGGGRGVCGHNICYHVASFPDSLQSDMQHDHALKKLNFYLLTPSQGSGCLWAKYLLPCCCIRDSV